MVDAPSAALLGASALHLGFQLTISVLVYPALVRSTASGWADAHDRHGRGVTPLVGFVYVVLLAASAWAVVAGPLRAGLVLSLVGVALSLGTTAVVAAPLHGRLGREGPQPALLSRLVRADRVRTAGAVLCTVGAVLVCLDL